MLTRRQFLALTGGTGGFAAAGAWGWGSWMELVREHLEDAARRSRHRTLVIVQLGGGNDGLNTVVPDDGRYRDARPLLAVPEDEVVRLRGLAGAGLHPALAPLATHWDARNLAILPSVGFTHAGRSHFECSQHWWDGSAPEEPSSTGWLGRWLDATAPSGGGHPLRAVALGAGSPALRAERSVATVVLRPEAFGVLTPPSIDAAGLAGALAQTAAPVSPDALVAAAQRAMSDALTAVDRLGDALDATDGAAGGELSGGLDLAAELIVRGLGVEVVTVGQSGFDTHAAQQATHAALLADLATGLQGFWQKVAAAGMGEDVLLMTTSEFGRRVAENGSAGTDHGLGGCQLLIGAGVAGGMVGDIDLGHLHQGDLRPIVDPRSVYAAAIEWLGGPADEVLDDYEDLGLLV